MNRVLPWIISALFAFLWWRRGQAREPAPGEAPPAPLPAPALPAARPAVRVDTLTARPQPRPEAPAAPRQDPPERAALGDTEPGKARLAGRRSWMWAGGGLLIVAALAVLLSGAYNAVPVIPDPRLQTGIAADGPSTLMALSGADPQQAPALLASYGCVACHTIPGISGAYGRVGPNLSHFYDHALIAGVLPNTPENLVRWIRLPQTVDPNSGMPNLGVSEQDARDIAAYLQTTFQ